MARSGRRARSRLVAFWRWVIEAPGAADESIAAFEKTKQLVGGAGDADAHALADGTPAVVDFAKPEFFVLAEIHAIVAAVDLQRLREAPRSAREIQKLGGFAMVLHDFDAFEGLERANQNGSGSFGRLAHDVEHEVRAIVEENVDVAGSEIHGTNARCGPAKMMTGRVARRISFGLDDAAADTSAGQIVHDNFADEETRKFDSVRGKFGSANPADRDFHLRFFQRSCRRRQAG